MAINELNSICSSLYFHLLKGGLRKRTRDDLGISIANILKQGIQFPDSNNHVNNDVDRALVTQLREKGYACLNNLLNDKEIEVLYQYFQDKKLQCVFKDKKIHCHLKFDTGMGRLGIHYSHAEDIISLIKDVKGIHLEGIYSHFSSSDEKDDEFMNLQADRFESIVKIADYLIPEKRYYHKRRSQYCTFPN